MDHMATYFIPWFARVDKAEVGSKPNDIVLVMIDGGCVNLVKLALNSP